MNNNLKESLLDLLTEIEQEPFNCGLITPREMLYLNIIESIRYQNKEIYNVWYDALGEINKHKHSQYHAYGWIGFK